MLFYRTFKNERTEVRGRDTNVIAQLSIVLPFLYSYHPSRPFPIHLTVTSSLPPFHQYIHPTPTSTNASIHMFVCLSIKPSILSLVIFSFTTHLTNYIMSEVCLRTISKFESFFTRQGIFYSVRTLVRPRNN